jgi:hypothetical protein
MHTNKKTIANSPYEEALSEFRAAVPTLQAIADGAPLRWPQVTMATRFPNSETTP